MERHSCQRKYSLLKSLYWQEIEVVSEKESKVNLRKEKYSFSPWLKGQRTKHFCSVVVLSAFFFFFSLFKEINTCFS